MSYNTFNPPPEMTVQELKQHLQNGKELGDHHRQQDLLDTVYRVFKFLLWILLATVIMYIIGILGKFEYRTELEGFLSYIPSHLMALFVGMLVDGSKFFGNKSPKKE